MIEYEYNFKVDFVEPFIEFCEQGGYTLVSKTKQNRVVFENKYNKNIISRITTTQRDGKKECLFDFKNIDNKNDKLKVSAESLPLKITGKNREIVNSMLDVMGFEQSADNLRTRYIYEKKDVKFEIDDYIRPIMKIVAIEGDKKKVDKVYDSIMKNGKLKKHIKSPIEKAF